MKVVWYFEEGRAVLWRGRCATLKRVVAYFEEGGVVLCRVWYCTLKRLMRYFEEGGVLLCWGWRGSLKRVVWYSDVYYFEQCGVVHWEGGWVLWRFCLVLWRRLSGTLKIAVWYYEEGCLTLENVLFLIGIIICIQLVSRALLECIRLFSSTMHYSFGVSNAEHAHIVFPFSQFPDKLIVSSVGILKML